MSVVARFANEHEARLVRSLLESYGIPVEVSSEHLTQSVLPMNIGEVRLSVPVDHRDEAARIIEAHRSQPREAQDAAEP